MVAIFDPPFPIIAAGPIQWGKIKGDWFIAAEQGISGVLIALIESGFDVNFAESFLGDTALIRAAQHGQARTVSVLLDHGADIQFASEEVGDALSAAIEFGDLEIVNFLLEAGAPLNSDEFPRLLEASAHGHIAVVARLIDLGVDLDHADDIEFTALKHSLLSGHDQIACLLLDHGADPMIGYDSQNAFELAIESGCSQAAKRLIEKGYKPLDELKTNPALFSQAGEGGSIECLEIFMNAGVDINFRPDENRPTALWYAVTEGNKEAVDFLLENGADSNLGSEELATFTGTDMVGEAAFWGHMDVVETVISSGHDLTRHSEAILKLVCANSPTASVISKIIDGGVRPANTPEILFYLTTVHDEDAEGIEIENAKINIGVKDDVEETYIEGEQELRRVAEILVASGVNPFEPRSPEYGRYPPLMYAVVRNHYALVEFLLEAASPTGQRYKQSDLQVALLLASRFGFTRISQSLLKAGADPNLSDGDGTYALAVAVDSRHYEVVRVLLDAGADPDLPKTEGGSLLMGLLDHAQHASGFRDRDPFSIYHISERVLLEMGHLLLDAGADPNIEMDGETALVRASRYNKREIIEKILDGDVPIKEAERQVHAALEAAIDQGATFTIYALLTADRVRQERLVSLRLLRELCDRTENRSAKNLLTYFLENQSYK